MAMQDLELNFNILKSIDGLVEMDAACERLHKVNTQSRYELTLFLRDPHVCGIVGSGCMAAPAYMRIRGYRVLVAQIS